jgi:hypothetical protein
MTTLDITIRMIRTVLEKQSVMGVIDSDHRGRIVGKVILEDNLTQSVKDHINSIPRIESHYLRIREFIEGGKTLTWLYKDYKPLSEANNESFVNLCTDIFLTHSLIFPSLCQKKISVKNASQTKIMKMSIMIIRNF